jgi:hypothetical protein
MHALAEEIDSDDRLIVGTLQDINSRNQMINGVPAMSSPKTAMPISLLSANQAGIANAFSIPKKLC